MREILDLTKFVLQFTVIVTDTTFHIYVTTQSVSDVTYCLWHILSVSSIPPPHTHTQVFSILGQHLSEINSLFFPYFLTYPILYKSLKVLISSF